MTFPTAAASVFPYPSHRTLAEVDRQERQLLLNAEVRWLGLDLSERVQNDQMRRGTAALLAAIQAARATDSNLIESNTHG